MKVVKLMVALGVLWTTNLAVAQDTTTDATDEVVAAHGREQQEGAAGIFPYAGAFPGLEHKPLLE